MLKTNLLIIIICLNIGNITAQSKKKEALGINGLSAFIHTDRNHNYFIQQSIGQQSVINIFNAGSYRLRQGFLQPINPSILNSKFDNVLDAVIFPNPFENTIRINFSDPINNILIVRLYDMSGRLIITKEYQSNQNIEVIVGNIATGVYTLRIDTGNKFLESKLIKK